MSIRRPSNASSSVAGPLLPISRVAPSTSIMGSRRRAAAIASPSRVCAFSRTRSAASSASKTLRSTMLGVPSSSRSVCCVIACLRCVFVFATSRRQPPVVILLQAAPAVPERVGRLAADARDQNVEVRVPARADAQHGRAVRQTAMDQGEQHVVALLGQLERDLAGLAECVGELVRRLDRQNPALDAMLLAKAFRAFAGWIGQLVVAPGKLESRADLQLHVARRKPAAAQLALREIGPDAIDGSGQQAFELQGGRFDQVAVAVEGCGLIHPSSPWVLSWWERCWHPLRAAAA